MSTPPRPVAPTRDDAFVAASSEVAGGRRGRYAGGASHATALLVVVALTCATVAVGLLAKVPCRSESWAPREQAAAWTQMCYSDLPYLYRERGLAEGDLPYLDRGDHPDLEYPVLSGALFGAAAWAARATLDTADADRGAVRFYDVLSLLAMVAAVAMALAVALTVPTRPWDGTLVAGAPVLALMATVNADLLPAALSALAVLAWTRERPALAGVLIGLGTAAKLYPLLLLGPVLLICARERRWADFGRAVGAAAVVWLVVDLPVWLAAPDAFGYFWTFNAERGADFGSPWYALSIVGRPVPAERLDLVVGALMVAACAAIAVVAWRAPVPPRLAQLGFLVVAAACLLNKVWSPQYALWLLPLAVLARPRWRDLLVWQAGEVVHFVVVWLYLDGLFRPDSALVGPGAYAAATWLRMGCLLWLVGVVVRDVLSPACDPVRTPVAAPP